MKQKIIGTIILITLLFPILSTTAIAQEYELRIGEITNGFSSIYAEIKYIEEDGFDPILTDVHWEIKIEGAIILTNRGVTGFIDQMEYGDIEIGIIKPVFGFGRITINVETWTDEYVHAPIVESVDGFLFGPFILIK